MIKIPFFIIVGILLSIILDALNLNPLVHTIVFLAIACVLAAVGVWVEEKWKNRLKPGDRVIIRSDDALNGQLATYVRRSYIPPRWSFIQYDAEYLARFGPAPTPTKKLRKL